MIYKTIITTLVLLSLAGCNSTNYNDALVAYMMSQEKVAAIQAERDVLVAQANAESTKAMVNADAGGTKIVDPVSGVITEVRNPNPYFYGKGNNVAQSQPTRQTTQLKLPQKQPNLTEKALGFVGNFVSKTVDVALTNAVPIFGIVEQNKTQRTVAEFDYKKSSDMFATMDGFGNSMESVANTATTSITDGYKSFASETKQMVVAGQQADTAQIQAYTENFKNNYTQVEKYETEILKELSEISTSSSVSESSWTLDEDELDNVPAVTP
ncbi:hypothetical protein N9064_00720 [bacterium]|nr:hypothetical protein [bacterium]